MVQQYTLKIPQCSHQWTSRGNLCKLQNPTEWPIFQQRDRHTDKQACWVYFWLGPNENMTGELWKHPDSCSTQDRQTNTHRQTDNFTVPNISLRATSSQLYVINTTEIQDGFTKDFHLSVCRFLIVADQRTWPTAMQLFPHSCKNRFWISVSRHWQKRGCNMLMYFMAANYNRVLWLWNRNLGSATFPFHIVQ